MNPPNLHVLLLEDDDVSAFIAETVLSEHDRVHHVHVAREVHSAERILGAHPIDLVVVDINLPNRDGIAWLQRQISEENTWKAVVLSASERPEDLARAEAEPRVVAFMHKPLRPEAVSALLEQL